MMQHRQLGSSGLWVSPLVLGTASFGAGDGFEAFGVNDVAAARRQVDVALDAGVNMIDTADVYSSGASETVVGDVLRGRRDRMLIGTKAGFPTGRTPNDAGLSYRHIIEACEGSLRRLQTDYIDLYQFHEWDGQTRLEETLAAVDALVQSGKVRYVGCSNWTGWQMMKALGIAERERRPRLVSNQVFLSLLERSAEYEIVPTALDQGLGLLLWAPLAGGLLSGKYRRGRPDPPGARHTGGSFPEPPIHDRERLYDTVEILVDIAEQHDTSATRVALAWLLRRPAVTALVIGARNEEQLVHNLGAVELELTEEDARRLEEVTRPLLVYPHWHQLMHAAPRLGAPELSLIRPHLDAVARAACISWCQCG
jgi:aryl-alcohol dehydrogenase-like predicted oxidoreductase